MRPLYWMIPVVALAVAIVANMASACEVNGEKDGLPALNSCPADVVTFLNRAVMCQYFAGEFGGDGSARDAEVAKELTTRKCDVLQSEKAAIDKKYATDAAVKKTITKVFSDFGIEF